MGRERVTFFKVQLCISAFRNRKDGRSKECKQKIFAAQTPPRKRGYVEDFAQSKTFFSHTAFTKVTALLLRYVHVTYGKIAARQARGYGVLYEVKPGSAQVLFFIYSCSQQDQLFCPARLREMTFTNVSLMFCRCEVIHFPKLPFVLKFHSLLWHLIYI